MANSSQRVTSDGTLSTLAISIEYFDRTEISVLFDGIVTTTGWSWVGTSDKTLQFTPNVPNGVEVTIQRSSDITEIRHGFSLGAAFKAGTIDENFKQILHIAQEARENPVYTDIFNDVDMHGYKFKNLADGVAPTDSVNMQQHTAQAVVLEDAITTVVANVAVIQEAVDNLSGIADASGNIFVQQDLEFADANARITGNFDSIPLKIQSNTGSTTAVNIKPPVGGYGTQLTLSGPPSSNNWVALDMSDTGVSLIADSTAYLGIPVPLMVGAGTNAKLTISPDVVSTFNFAGATPRITGDLSNALQSNRLMIQSSTVNANSTLTIMPNGTATSSGFATVNSSDPDNASTTTIQVTSLQSRLIAGKTGTGSYKPLALNVGGADVVTVDTTTNVGIATSAPKARLHISGTSAYGYLWVTNTDYVEGATGSGVAVGLKTPSGSADGTIQVFKSGFATTGDLLLQPSGGNTLHSNFNGGLGYGAGAGGTVTQTTSKSTAVTLNRPCGVVIMYGVNDANGQMTAGSTRTFAVNTSILSGNDGVVLTPSWTAVDPINYKLELIRSAATIFTVKVTNISTGTLAESFAFLFQIVKGSNA